MSVKEAINKRTTTKIYKDGPEITDEQMEELMHAANLAPSSNDIQNSRILVLKSQEAREKYKPYFEPFNDKVLDGAKAVFIFIGNPWNNYKKDGGKYFIEAAMGNRDQPQELKEKYKDGIFNYYDHISSYSDSIDIVSTTIQYAYVDLLATEMGFDSTTMGGIKKADMEAFMLKEGTLNPGERVDLALAIGYADPDSQRNIEHTRHRIAEDKIYKVI